MTTLIYNKYTIEKQPIFHNGKELKSVDYRDTTANKEFCKITFLDNTSFLVQSFKIDIN